jgi:uncharacterized membrane protein
MSENLEPMDSGAEELVAPAEEAMEATEHLGEDLLEEASAEDFGDRAEGFVTEAGNFIARNISDDPEANSDDRVWSLAAYLSQVVVPVVVPVLMLVVEPNKDRPFQKYHAVQSLGFLVAVIIYEIVVGTVVGILTAITLGCLLPILLILLLLPAIAAVYYAYLAYQGRRFEMPYLTKFMREQGWL